MPKVENRAENQGGGFDNFTCMGYSYRLPVGLFIEKSVKKLFSAY
jgi:hypothetical protein